MDSRIIKVHLPTCTTLYCLLRCPKRLIWMGFWDASFFPSHLMRHHIQHYFNRQGVQLPRLLIAECLHNLAKFLPLPKVACLQSWACEKSIFLLASCQKSSHFLHRSATSKSSSIFKLHSGFYHCHMIGTEVVDQNQINQSKSTDL